MGKTGQGEAVCGVTLGPQLLSGYPWFPSMEVQIPCTLRSSSHDLPSAPTIPAICNQMRDEGGVTRIN